MLENASKRHGVRLSSLSKLNCPTQTQRNCHFRTYVLLPNLFLKMPFVELYFKVHCLAHHLIRTYCACKNGFQMAGGGPIKHTWHAHKPNWSNLSHGCTRSCIWPTLDPVLAFPAVAFWVVMGLIWICSLSTLSFNSSRRFLCISGWFFMISWLIFLEIQENMYVSPNINGNTNCKRSTPTMTPHPESFWVLFGS